MNHRDIPKILSTLQVRLRRYSSPLLRTREFPRLLATFLMSIRAFYELLDYFHLDAFWKRGDQNTVMAAFSGGDRLDAFCGLVAELKQYKDTQYVVLAGHSLLL